MIKSFVLITICCLLFICGKPPGPKLPDKHQPLYHVLTDWQKNDLHGRVKSVKTAWYWLRDENSKSDKYYKDGVDIQKFNSDGYLTYYCDILGREIEKSENYTYDSATHFLIQKKAFFTGVYTSMYAGKWNYTYNYKTLFDSLVGITRYESSNDSTSQTLTPVIKYNPDGTEREEMIAIMHGAPQLFTNYIRYTYNDKHLLVETGEYTADGILYDKETCVYNDSALVSKRTKYDYRDGIDTDYINYYYYDNKNRLLRDSATYGSGIIPELRGVFTDYDNAGNWHQLFLYSQGRCLAKQIRKIEYYK